MKTKILRSLGTVILVSSLSFTVPVHGQFVLEHVYPSGSLFIDDNQLFLLELESSGWKYVLVDRQDREVEFYNLDHSFWKSVSFGMTTVLSTEPAGCDILYISEHLFDLDDGIEFMYHDWHPMAQPISVTQVVDEETGTLIFNVGAQSPAIRPNYDQQQYPIQSTPNGTKLILSSMAYLNDSAYVYGLAGSLSLGMEHAWGHASAGDVLRIFPNPSNSEVSVVLPTRLSNAVVEIVSSDGRVVRSDTVLGTSALLDIRALPAGRYTCRVHDPRGRPCFGSFIKP